MFCFGLPDDAGGTRVLAQPLFRADPALNRETNLRRARDHFQGVLRVLESLVRQRPLLWFNFLPLNPPATAEASRGRS
jgi:hypothetical protein